MTVLFYIMIGLFVLDIVLGLICGYIDGKRAAKLEMRLESIELHLYDEMTDNVFPEFKDGKHK